MKKNDQTLPVILGRYCATWQTCEPDLRKLEHILIVGGPGQGKTTCINNMIASLLDRFDADYIRLILADPKRTELQQYSDLDRRYTAGHPVCDGIVVSDCRRITETLKSLRSLIDDRYDRLKEANVRNIEEYNQSGKYGKMPYTIMIIDEFADLMIDFGTDFEDPLLFITQLGRAVGVHLVISTVCMSEKVITNDILDNFNSYIVFGKTALSNAVKMIRVTADDLIFQQQGEMFITVNPTEVPAKVRLDDIEENEIIQAIGKANSRNLQNP